MNSLLLLNEQPQAPRRAAKQRSLEQYEFPLDASLEMRQSVTRALWPAVVEGRRGIEESEQQWASYLMQVHGLTLASLITHQEHVEREHIAARLVAEASTVATLNAAAQMHPWDISGLQPAVRCSIDHSAPLISVPMAGKEEPIICITVPTIGYGSAASSTTGSSCNPQDSGEKENDGETPSRQQSAPVSVQQPPSRNENTTTSDDESNPLQLSSDPKLLESISSSLLVENEDNSPLATHGSQHGSSTSSSYFKPAVAAKPFGVESQFSFVYNSASEGALTDSMISFVSAQLEMVRDDEAAARSYLETTALEEMRQQWNEFTEALALVHGPRMQLVETERQHRGFIAAQLAVERRVLIAWFKGYRCPDPKAQSGECKLSTRQYNEVLRWLRKHETPAPIVEITDDDTVSADDEVASLRTRSTAAVSARCEESPATMNSVSKLRAVVAAVSVEFDSSMEPDSNPLTPSTQLAMFSPATARSESSSSPSHAVFDVRSPTQICNNRERQLQQRLKLVERAEVARRLQLQHEQIRVFQFIARNGTNLADSKSTAGSTTISRRASLSPLLTKRRK